MTRRRRQQRWQLGKLRANGEMATATVIVQWGEDDGERERPMYGESANTTCRRLHTDVAHRTVCTPRQHR
eukprot:6534334-Alexandrium_andersonii.AAC.1